MLADYCSRSTVAFEVTEFEDSGEQHKVPGHPIEFGKNEVKTQCVHNSQ